MRKETLAKLLTALLVAAVVVVVLIRQGNWPADLPSSLSVSQEAKTEPSDAIYCMLDAARAGDGDAYIACHDGQLAKQLEQSRQEMGEGGFAEYLLGRNREIKGIAINEPEQTSENEAQVRVEYVFADRNEAQRYGLKRVGGEWKIAVADGAQRVKTVIPYGTPVY